MTQHIQLQRLLSFFFGFKDNVSVHAVTFGIKFFPIIDRKQVTDTLEITVLYKCSNQTQRYIHALDYHALPHFLMLDQIWDLYASPHYIRIHVIRNMLNKALVDVCMHYARIYVHTYVIQVCM